MRARSTSLVNFARDTCETVANDDSRPSCACVGGSARGTDWQFAHWRFGLRSASRGVEALLGEDG